MRKQNDIILISLVMIIVLLIILVSVSINFIFKENRMMSKIKQIKDEEIKIENKIDNKNLNIKEKIDIN